MAAEVDSLTLKFKLDEDQRKKMNVGGKFTEGAYIILSNAPSDHFAEGTSVRFDLFLVSQESIDFFRNAKLDQVFNLTFTPE